MADLIKKTIGDKVKKVMKSKHLSRNDVAVACNVSLSQLDKIKDGSRKPSVDFAEKFAKLTDTNVLDYLTSDTAEKRLTAKSWTIAENNLFFVQYLSELGFISTVKSFKADESLGSFKDIETLITIGYGGKPSKEKLKKYLNVKKAYEKKPTPKNKAALDRAQFDWQFENNERMSNMPLHEFLDLKSEIDEAVTEIMKRRLRARIDRNMFTHILMTLDNKCQCLKNSSDENKKDELIDDMRQLIKKSEIRFIS